LADVDALVRRFSSATATWTAAPGGKTSSVPIAGVGDGAVLGLGAVLGAAEGLAPSDASGDDDDSGSPAVPVIDGVGPLQAAMSTTNDPMISLRTR
jgi:hypothetical protein